MPQVPTVASTAVTLCVVQVMKQIWSADELGEHWTVSHDEFALLKGKTAIAPSGLNGRSQQLDGYRPASKLRPLTNQ